MWLYFMYNYKNNIVEGMLIIYRSYRALEDEHEYLSDSYLLQITRNWKYTGDETPCLQH